MPGVVFVSHTGNFFFKISNSRPGQDESILKALRGNFTFLKRAAKSPWVIAFRAKERGRREKKRNS